MQDEEATKHWWEWSNEDCIAGKPYILYPKGFNGSEESYSALYTRIEYDRRLPGCTTMGVVPTSQRKGSASLIA